MGEELIKETKSKLFSKFTKNEEKATGSDDAKTGQHPNNDEVRLEDSDAEEIVPTVAVEGTEMDVEDDSGSNGAGEDIVAEDAALISMSEEYVGGDEQEEDGEEEDVDDEDDDDTGL